MPILRPSNQQLTVVAESNTTVASSGTQNVSGITYVGAGNVSVGVTNGSVIISGSGGGAADGYNIIAAGTQTANTTGTVILSNSNNVSFGMSNGSVITASASYSQSTAPAAISAGTALVASGTVILSNSNGISFGVNGNTVTASHNALTSQSNQALSGSNGSLAFQTATFGNLNGLSFYTSNGSMVGSYTVPSVPAQTNQTIGGYAVGNTTGQSSSITFDARSVSINGGGIVSVGYSAGSLLVSATTTQSAQTQNIVVPSAGTQTATSGTVVWSNSNNVSFGMSNNSVITASASYSQSTAPAAISAGTTQATSGTVVLSDSNGISFGVNGNTVTASHNALTSQSNQALSGSNGSFAFQTATFGNLNGLSFYTSNGSMVGSYTVPTQTVQTLGSYAVGNTTGQSSSTTFDARTASISGAGIVSVGYSAGNIVISASAAGAADGVNIIAAGTQTANTTGTVVFSNSHNVSFGMSNNSVVTASASYSQSTAPAAISAGTTQATSGTVVLSNSNGISFGVNGNTVTASHNALTSQSNQALSGSNGSFAFQTATFGNLNGLSFYTSNGSMVGSYTVPTQTAQTIGGYAVGNTTGQSSSSTFDARTLSLNGAGNISLGYSGGSIIISGSQTAQTQNIVVPGAGTQTATSGTVVWSNSNGVSFGMSGSSRITASVDAIKSLSAGTTRLTNGEAVFGDANGISFGVNGNTVTASHNALTSQSNQALSGSNGSFAFQTATFGNLNGLSFYTSNGSMVGSYTVPSVPAQTNQTIGGYAVGNTTGQSSSSTFDARTLSLNGAGLVSVGYSNSSIIISATSAAQTVQTQNIVVPGAGTQTATSGTVVFSNSNGISFGMSNSSIITASYTVPTQSNQTLGSYAVGNTTGQSSSTTFDARTASISGAGIVSVGYSAGNIVISALAAGAADGVNIIAAGTQTANTTGTVMFSNSHNVSFGMSNSSVVTASASYSQSTAPAAISAGTTQATSGTIVLSNSNGISFGINGNTVTASYTVPTQTVQTIGGYAVGNTTGQSSSTTFDARTLSFNGAGNISLGYSGGSVVISGSQTAQTQNIVVPGAGTQTATSGTVVWSNSNGVSFGMSGSSRITASVDAIKSVSAGTTRLTNGEAVFGDANGISFGVNGNTVTASHNALTSQSNQALSGSNGSFAFQTATFGNLNGLSFYTSNGSMVGSYTVPTQTVQTIGGYAVGNTTGQSSSTTFDARTLSFNGAGNISLGYSGGSVVVSGSQTAQTQNVVVPGAGTQTATSGTVVWSNSNGVSFGMSGSSRITASVDAIKSVSAGTTRLTNGEAVFGDANGISFGVNGNTVTASHNALTSQSNQALSGSNGSFTFQTATFGNLNGFSFYTSNGSMVGSYTVPTQTNQTIGMYAVGNTTGQSSSSTFDARTVSISGLGNISVGYSGSNIIISGAGGGGGIAAAAGTQTGTSGTIVFSNSNNITFGMSNSSVVTASYSQSNQVLSVLATSNTTQSSSGTINASNLIFNGAGIASVGVSNGSVVISVPAGGGAGDGYNILAAGTQTATTAGTVVFSNSNNVSFGMSGSTRITASFERSEITAGAGISLSSNGSTVSIIATDADAEYAVPPWGNQSALITNVTALTQRPLFFPFMVRGQLTADNLKFNMSRSTSGSNNFTIHVGIYTISNNTAINLLGSTSASYSATATASVSGIRQFLVPMGTALSTLSSGPYVLGLIMSATATASMNYSFIGGTTANPPVGVISAGADTYITATSYKVLPFWGRFTTTSGAMPSSVAQSNIIGAFTGASLPLPLGFSIAST